MIKDAHHIFSEFERLIDGMYIRTNIKSHSSSKQTYRGGHNDGLDRSKDTLKIVLGLSVPSEEQ